MAEGEELDDTFDEVGKLAKAECLKLVGLKRNGKIMQRIVSKSSKPVHDKPQNDFHDDDGVVIEIDELERELKIDENALEESLQAQPLLFYQVAKQLALQISRRDQAKQGLSEIEAEIDLEIREMFRKDERKVTEREIDAEKTKDKSVVAAHKSYAELGTSVGQLSALKEAYMQRGYVLREMVALYLANYYGSDPTIKAPGEMRNRQASEAKSELNKARRERT